MTPGQALTGLYYSLSEHGVATVGMNLGRRSGRMYPVTGGAVGYCCGLFWWHAGRLRHERPVYAIHPATDPAGAARRIVHAAQR